MEIALFVIAVIGLLALSGGGGISGNVRVQPTPGQSFDPTPFSGSAYPVGRPGIGITPNPNYPPMQFVGPAAPPPGPSTWSPTATAPFNPPMAPSTGANVDGQLIMGGAAIGTAALPFLHIAALTSATIPVVGAAILAVAAIAVAILQAHQKRLTDATNENQAVDQWLPVFDSFVSSVVGAYNSGQIDAANAAKICQQFDQTLYTKFRSFVGQPGTAWDDQLGMAGQCSRSCTVGCCVYFGDLGPVLNNISYVLGYPTGKWGQGDPRIHGRTIIVPKIYPSKYSSYTRAQYSITLN